MLDDMKAAIYASSFHITYVSVDGSTPRPVISIKSLKQLTKRCQLPQNVGNNAWNGDQPPQVLAVQATALE